MSKSNNLSDYLSDLYQGIASKRENPSRNPQDFRREIEQIETKSPEWDGTYETSPDMDFTDSPVIREAPDPITANGDYTAADLVAGADGISRFTVAVEGGSGEEVPVWDGTSGWTKTFNDTLSMYPDEYIYGENDMTERFSTAWTTIPGIGDVKMFCNSISQGGEGALYYGIVRIVPDISGILDVEFPFELCVYEDGKWLTEGYGEGIRRITFNPMDMSTKTFEWVCLNTTPEGVEPTAEAAYGYTEVPMYPGEVLVLGVEGKKLEANITFKANEGYIKPSGNLEITENGDNIDVAEFATVSVKVPSTCDRPLAYWFFTGVDQREDMEWDDEGNESYTRSGIKESVTVPPQVQDGSATSFENLFQSVTEYPYDLSMPMWTTGLWVKKIEGVINCENVTSLKELFYGCSETEEICPIINTENVTDFNHMFCGCSALISGPTIDVSGAEDLSAMYAGCRNIERMNIKNVKISFMPGNEWGGFDGMTAEGWADLCYELVNTGSTKTLTIGKSGITALQSIYIKDIDNSDPKKSFILCESTDEGAITLADYVTRKNWALAGR